MNKYHANSFVISSLSKLVLICYPVSNGFLSCWDACRKRRRSSMWNSNANDDLEKNAFLPFQNPPGLSQNREFPAFQMIFTAAAFTTFWGPCKYASSVGKYEEVWQLSWTENLSHILIALDWAMPNESAILPSIFKEASFLPTTFFSLSLSTKIERVIDPKTIFL